MWFRRVGQGAGDALFLHCGLAAHTSLVPLAAQFAELAVTLPDLLGHGHSSPPAEGCDLAAQSAAAETVWHGHSGVVLGHSFGAVIALRMAVNAPQIVRRLILVEPVLFAAAAGTAAAQDLDRLQAPMAAAFAAGDGAAAAQHFLNIWNGPDAWAAMPPKAQRYAAARMQVIQDTAADLWQDRTGLLAPGMLERVTCPVHLIRGDQSHPVIADIHAALMQRLPAQEDVITGAGHMLPVTHTKVLAGVIRSAGSGTDQPSHPSSTSP